MGGKVTINTEVGIGTKFNIILQLKVIDRIFYNPSSLFSTSEQKIDYLISLDAFKYTYDFYQYFSLQEGYIHSIDVKSDQFDQSVV